MQQRHPLRNLRLPSDHIIHTGRSSSLDLVRFKSITLAWKSIYGKAKFSNLLDSRAGDFFVQGDTLLM